MSVFPSLRAVVVSAVAIAFAACGGASPEPKTAGSAAKAWKDMSHDERRAFMGETILPTMKAEFQAWDPKFASMSCETCHGDGASDGTFAMPNPKLPIIPSTPDGFAKLGETKPAAMKFMMTHVEPKMADLLSLPRWNEATKQGFGCGNCHVEKP